VSSITAAPVALGRTTVGVPSRRLLRRKRRRLGLRALLSAVMLALAAGMALPFYYIVVNTFKTAQQAATAPLALPSPFTLQNYRNVIGSVPLLQTFANSAYVTVLGVLATVLFGSMAAYAMNMRRTRGNRLLRLVLVLALAVPFQVTVVPLYEMMVKAGLVNSLSGLVIVYMAGAVFCFFLIDGYMATIPKELVEAAKIDGAGVVQVYARIVMPLCAPVLATVAIFQTIGIWNDFLVANTFLSSSQKYTIVLQVYGSVGQFTTNWPSFMTLTTISLLPMVVFFVIMQRKIMGGLASGAVKG
jgi:raffinose/stachyose/melibiose transport system permease protein